MGKGFRVPGPGDNVYTLAAEAALKLILAHEIDPRSVGYLAVGTESSTDNATSAAVIVRGLVDQALAARGLPALARDIEAPEIKQACLGGLYGVKAALRYLALDGAQRVAIVVAADIAEYARGSSGEPTQGAGAVAMLLEPQARLLRIDLHGSANASSYRALDFRKPFARYRGQAAGASARLKDFPVFNGRYSTACYVEATIASMSGLLGRHGQGRAAHLRGLAAVFMHRPYQRMPATAWALVYLFALAADASDDVAAHAELSAYAGAAGVPLQAVVQEMRSRPDLLGQALEGELVDDPYPLCTRLAKALRSGPAYREVVEDKMRFGQSVCLELGNLYSASLPAWLAAGLEEAASSPVALPGDEVLLVGYGSGDASEALPARLVSGWERAALRTRTAQALAGAADLDQAQYHALHDGRLPADWSPAPHPGIHVARIGERTAGPVQDFGIEYYALGAWSRSSGPASVSD